MGKEKQRWRIKKILVCRENRQLVISLLENKLITINNVGVGFCYPVPALFYTGTTPISYKNPVNFFDIEEKA